MSHSVVASAVESALASVTNFDELLAVQNELRQAYERVQDVTLDQRLHEIAVRLPPMGRIGIAWRNEESGEGLLLTDAQFFYEVGGVEYLVPFGFGSGLDDGWPVGLVDAHVLSRAVASAEEFEAKYGSEALKAAEVFDDLIELLTDYRNRYGREDTETADFPAAPYFLR